MNEHRSNMPGERQSQDGHEEAIVPIRPGLGRAEQTGGALGGVGRGGADVERARALADREAEAGLGVVALGGERVGHHEGGGLGARSPHAGG